MLASPAKRRKTSPNTSVAIDASNPDSAASILSNPSTPKHASFQSPTKASLARSHPGLLSRSPARRQLETRGKIRHNGLLSRSNSRNASRPSLSAPQTPRKLDESTEATQVPATTASVPAESFSAAIARTFAKPSSRSSLSRSPRRAREPTIQRVDRRQLRNTDIIPESTRSPLAIVGNVNTADNAEPELPPTPVQLGLETRPEKPRGLASSSSPRTSRSGSHSERRRAKLNSSHTSSPLKPKDRIALADRPIPNGPSLARIMAGTTSQEALESEIEPLALETGSRMPEEILQKQSLRDELAGQLGRLQTEMSRLEAVLEDSSKATTTKSDTDILELLTTKNPSCAAVDANLSTRSSSPTLPNPIDLGSNAIPFLTLFAPGNLQLHETTTSSLIDGRPHQTRLLELSAPRPWPAHVFGARISVSSDVQDHRITSMEVVLLRPRNGHRNFRAWMRKRSSSPLQRYDVGGFIWGLGSWWTECVKRAMVWRSLDETFNHKPKNKGGNVAEVADVGPQDVPLLLPYLARTMMEYSLTDPAGASISGKNRQSGGFRRKVLLTWDMELDWTGEVDPHVDVCATGISKDSQIKVKEVFERLKELKGVSGAMEGVWKVLDDATEGMRDGS